METINVTVPQHGGIEEITINMEELKAMTPLKVGNTCPNITSQINYTVRSIEKRKNDMLKTASQMFWDLGVGIVDLQMDAIYNYLSNELFVLRESRNEDCEWFGDVVQNVYSMVEMAKHLFDLYRHNQAINNSMRDIKYTQKGVLM